MLVSPFTFYRGAALLFAIAACDDEEDPEVAFCESLVALTASVDELSSLDAASSVDEYNSAVDKVSEAVTEVKDSAGDLAEEQVAAIQAAVDDLKSYKDDLDSSMSVTEAVQGSGASLAAIQAARAEAGTVNCAEAAAEEAAEE